MTPSRTSPPTRFPDRSRLLARRWWATWVGTWLLAACGGGGGSPANGSSASAPTPPTTLTAEVSVLMMGNSHTSSARLPEQLAALLRGGLPGKTVAVAVAPGWMFLDERLAHGPSMALLRSQPWTAVVLQAQKYITSGQYSYSTLEAELLVQAARGQRALPVLFPEWPRLGVPETAQIHDLHVGIAQAQPACVAPIGQAWDLALQRHPTLRLHSDDGNHADVPGAYLAALVLYSAITGGSPRTLPDIDNGLAPSVQAQLRAAAADTLQTLPARRHCPADAVLVGAGPRPQG